MGGNLKRIYSKSKPEKAQPLKGIAKAVKQANPRKRELASKSLAEAFKIPKQKK